MKFVIAFVAFTIAVVAAAPASDGDLSATALRDNRANNGVDNYQFDFETSNGISRQESGTLKSINDNAAIVVSGSTSWTSPEGQLIELKFTADELGYHPIV